MLDNRTRALLDRYGLASRALSRLSGERSAVEPGQSVEFHDFRPYQPGDELRYVDWRTYARTGRLYTRLYQAERAVKLHLVLDTSASMALFGKAEYARTLMQLLSYVAQRDAPTQLHLLDGRSSRPARGRGGIRESWRFIDEAAPRPGRRVEAAERRPRRRRAAEERGREPEAAERVADRELLPLTGLKRFALSLPALRGNALVLVVSDLLEDVSLQPTLAALKARGVDVGFLQLLSDAELDPPAALLELVDVESGERLPVGPDEARAYKAEMRAFLARTRSAVLQAGFKHLLLRVPYEPAADGSAAATERDALAALIRSGVIVKR